jgi:hypothetical protein
MNEFLLFILHSSFYEETGDATEYFWQIDRKIQFGELKLLSIKSLLLNAFLNAEEGQNGFTSA